MSPDEGDRPILHSCPLPPGCLPIRVVEVLQFMNEEGNVENAVRWAGTGDIVSELGMLEYAKLQIYEAKRADLGEEETSD